MRACFTSQVHYDQGLFGFVSGVRGTVHTISGNTGYINEVYVTGSDGEWCQVQCSTPFSCTDLSGCHVVYDTGHQVISGDLVVTGYISGSSLNIGDCALSVTTGGQIGINTCEPLCDIDIRGDVCHNSGNYINNSGYISGKTGIFDWLSGNSGYMRDEFTVGTGDCVFIVTTGGDIGINTCEPLCDIDIRGDMCHNSGNYLNNSGYISGKTGIFDWLSGNSGYMRDEFTVGTGDCVFVVTTGGLIGVNTCDPQCDVEIYADICHQSGSFTNYSGYISGKTGIFDWLSGNSGYMRDKFMVATGGAGGNIALQVTAEGSYFYHDAYISGGNLTISGEDPRIKIDGITDSHPGLEFSEDGVRKWIIFNHYAQDNLSFKTDTDTRMSIEQGGNVGIGTSNPSHKLEVVGSISGQSLSISGLNPILWTGVPATDTSQGLPGLAAYSDSHLYICTGLNKWGRTNLTGWS